jgi:diguanylate cyclase (GGDEF)-like protein/PAS domain S-box-containing protein
MAEEALRASEAELRGVFTAMTDTVLICDRNGENLRIAPTNRASRFESPEEIRAKTLQELMPPTVTDKLLEQVQKSLNSQKTAAVDYSLDIDGKKVWFAAAISPIRKDRAIIVARDITDRKATEEKLVRQALYDSLTGLPNRTLFMDRLERAVERVKRFPNKIVAVLFLDLDRFKVINDSLGHASGDLFLSTIAQRLRTCMRSSDTVARFGGDEFAFLLEDIPDVKEAIHIADRIQTELASPIILDGHEVFTSGSIGIALANSKPRRPEEILRDADMAMYRAKAKGKGCSETFDARMHEEMAALLKMETDLRRAADRGELSLYYQPILDLNSGSIVSVEALLRWRHPQLGMLLPGQFINLAEETRLIYPIGEWVLWTACSQAKSWHDAGYKFIRVSINISARQFQEPQLLELVPRVLAETGLEPQYLELEVSEQAAMQDFDLTVKTLYELSRIGVRISIDDFGKGYSSLSYLKNFPTNTVKIDRSFIQDVNHNQHDADIASAIIAMAHTLRLNVIAEGVETKQQMNFLALNQCDQIQGFLISKAVPDWELGEILQTRNFLQTAQLQFEI